MGVREGKFVGDPVCIGVGWEVGRLLGGDVGDDVGGNAEGRVGDIIGGDVGNDVTQIELVHARALSNSLQSYVKFSPNPHNDLGIIPVISLNSI